MKTLGRALFRYRFLLLGALGWGLVLSQPVPAWQFPQYAQY
jgi:hypothetical protein